MIGGTCFGPYERVRRERFDAVCSAGFECGGRDALIRNQLQWNKIVQLVNLGSFEAKEKRTLHSTGFFLSPLGGRNSNHLLDSILSESLDLIKYLSK